MNGLVREMLDYTRLDRTDELKNRKTLNLTALVCDVLTEYAPLFEKRRLTADIADGVRIRGDETLLRRAVGCLLENAAKYSPENGRVSVRLTNSRNHLLTVENDCEPIPETELPRLFEMFYRGDKARDPRRRTRTGTGHSAENTRSARPDMQGGKYKGRRAVHCLQ